MKSAARDAASCEQALRVLEADAVQRSEKAVGVARWLLALHDATGAIAGSRRDDLRGCRDLEAKGGAGFFPEQLRSEYHEIRSVMEAYARTAEVGGRDEGDANGLALEGAQTVTARTTGPLGSAVYEIDRID